MFKPIRAEMEASHAPRQQSIQFSETKMRYSEKFIFEKKWCAIPTVFVPSALFLLLDIRATILFYKQDTTPLGY
ncbi:unnamed protein product [Urochloa humidicola]